MKIKKIEYDFSVCKVADYSEVNAEAEYCFTGKTDEENSLVCFTSDVPSNTLERDDGWKACCILSTATERTVPFMSLTLPGRSDSRCRRSRAGCG